MAKVYFQPLKPDHSVAEAGVAAAGLFEKLVQDERVEFAEKVPLKVHFGEKGNHTFLSSEHYLGIIESLKRRKVETCYIETNVLYGGKRNNRTAHLQTAADHGFTQIPIEIADGEIGQEFLQVPIEGRQFKQCLIAKGFEKYKQMVVVAHFKGHTLAGFGGAIKQLAMGCASRGGKMAQHQTVKPFILPFLCTKCGACKRVCAADAIHIGTWSKIHADRCIGCAACLSACPRWAIHTNYLRFFMLGGFTEKIAEYAYAAQLGKKNLYINFATLITSACDCIPRTMTPLMPDVGVFASTDPVAIDQACLDLIDKAAGKKVFTRGRDALEFAEKLGVGQRTYELISDSLR